MALAVGAVTWKSEGFKVSRKLAAPNGAEARTRTVKVVGTEMPKL
jgi:hypothetical protein